jgi:hypothetical protein
MFQAVTAALERDCHDNTPDTKGEQHKRKLEHGRNERNRSEQKEGHSDNMDEQVGA